MIKVTALSILCCTMLAGVLFGRLMAIESPARAGNAGESGGFQPVVEAPLPEGFPAYTPVGVVELKHYPAYRKAETSGRAAFWTLFQHITSAGISMTAPVEMTFQDDGPPAGGERSMAFLYGSQDIGTPGRKGDLEVVDVPAATVVSIGVRGQRSDDALVQAEQRLRAWLATNNEAYAQTGPLRVMGYNSPFVARDRQFFEVQIPVRQVAKATAS